MADVIVTFGAVDQGLTATITNLKNQVVSLQATPSGTGFQAAAQRANQAAGAINNVARAQNNVADASSRAGNMVERMFERMVIRAGIALAIFGTIHEILKLIGEGINFETVDTRFRSLIGNAETAARAVAKVDEAAKRTGMAKEDLEGAALELKKMGLSAEEAGNALLAIGGYAKITGEDIKKLAQEFANVKLGRGSVSDMLDLTAAMGPAGEALHQQVVDYEKMQTALQRVTKEQAHSNMLLERSWALADRQWSATNRLQDAQAQFGEKVGITDKIFKSMQEGLKASQAPREVTYVGGRDIGGRAAEVAGKRLEAGEKQIEQEEQISEADMKALERAGLISAKDLEAAANRAREDARKKVEQEREDQLYDKRLKLETAEIDLMHDMQEAQKKITEAIEKQTGVQANLAKEQGTAASALERFGQTLKAILENMPQINQAIADLANTATEFITKHQGVIEAMANLIAGIVQGMAAAIEGVGTLIDDIKEKFPALIPAVKDFIKNIGPALKDFVTQLTTNIDEALGEIKDMIKTITDLLQKLFDMLPNLAKQAQTVVGNINKAVPILPQAPYGGKQPWEVPQPAPGRGHEEIRREREAGDLATEPTLKAIEAYLKGLFTVSATP